MPRRHRGTAQGDDLDDNGHTTADPVVATLPHWGSAAGGRRRAVIPLIETPLAPRCKKKASCHFDHPACAMRLPSMQTGPIIRSADIPGLQRRFGRYGRSRSGTQRCVAGASRDRSRRPTAVQAFCRNLRRHVFRQEGWGWGVGDGSTHGAVLSTNKRNVCMMRIAAII